MSEFSFNFEWEDPQGAKGPELRATWARLSIMIADTPITRLSDVRNKSIRDSIYVPLYPLAEWIATHWWSLLNECEAPGLGRQETYALRHNLMGAREGFALPNLEFCPLGQRILLKWRAALIPEKRVRFIEGGTAYVDPFDLKQAFSSFVNAVVSRLENEGLHNTVLQEEWQSINQADKDEEMFCVAAGSLGVDPYAADNMEKEAILVADRTVPPELIDEFLAVGDVRHLTDQASYLHDIVERQGRSDGILMPLIDLRAKMHQRIHQDEPWEEGYDFARALRAELGLNGKAIASLDEMDRVFRLDHGSFNGVTNVGSPNRSFFDGLMVTNTRESPSFTIQKKGEKSQRFTLCRSLFEYMTVSGQTSALVSCAHSDRQKRNRAFAAEFLAPSEVLRTKISGRRVTEEETEELAEEFGVSPYVISHQIENHGIADPIDFS